MQAGSGSIFQPGLATGPSPAVELISSHARIGGSVFDRRIRFSAGFTVFNRRSVVATAVG
jgi:hypothetical protein